jgi:regulator of CtrA degradation
MIKSTEDENNNLTSDVTVDFGQKYAQSSVFDKVFREGMALVEETAAYLDGPGRKDSQELVRPDSLTYATESMRLTTRLMQLASWLLLQRAVKEGEMTHQEVLQEKYRIKLEELGPGNIDGAEKLPDGLTDLINHSLRLHERVMRLDLMLRTKADERSPEQNAVSDQMTKLVAAFNTGSGC